jgi:hypothetical protein
MMVLTVCAYYYIIAEIGVRVYRFCGEFPEF